MMMEKCRDFSPLDASSKLEGFADPDGDAGDGIIALTIPVQASVMTTFDSLDIPMLALSFANGLELPPGVLGELARGEWY